MAHVVTENCVDCKFTDCVEVCPVSCFYESEKQLVINPDECIDCNACIPECPVEAIFPEDEVPEKFQSSIAFNAEESERLEGEGPIMEQKDPLPTAEERKKALGF